MSGQSLTVKSIDITPDGKILPFDTPPIIENGRTDVPFRIISEAFRFKADCYFYNNGAGRAVLISPEIVENQGSKNPISLKNLIMFRKKIK